MAGIAGFIDYGPDGRPFMGLEIESGNMQVKVYIAHKDNAIAAAAELSRQIKAMAHDLVQTPDKLIEVNGVVNDAAFRKAEVHKGR